MHSHHNALGLANRALDEPVQPVTLLRPHAAQRAARFFVEKFPGKSLYAVKANPSPDLITLLVGQRHHAFRRRVDCRSAAGSRARCPKRRCASCTRSRPRKSIREAYFEHGVRTFSLDTLEELDKIVRATEGATDLTLCVRIRVSSEHSKLSLAAKFGADPAEMKQLLIATRQVADALGICFHVGSQAMTPTAYTAGDGAGARRDCRIGRHG